MVLEIQNTGGRYPMTANGWDVFLVQQNGQVTVGNIASKRKSLHSEFRTTNGKSMVSMTLFTVGTFPQPRRGIITSDVEKDAHTYYTFDYHGKQTRMQKDQLGHDRIVKEEVYK